MELAILLMFCLLINDQIWPVWGLALPRPGLGGDAMAGDPAPGRSPGPPVNQDNGHKVPQLSFSLEDENPTVVLTASGSELSCDFDRLFKSDEYSDGVDTDEFAGNKKDLLNLTVEHNLFRTDVGLVEGVQYEVSIFSTTEDMLAFDLLVSSLVNGLPHGQFRIQNEERISSSILECHERGSSSAVAAHLNAGEHVRLNWTMPILFADISNVTFRLQYQVEGKFFIRDIFYNFTSTEECRLYLRLAESNISWTDIPDGVRDCELHFPLQSDRHGLLVDLNRLNVPCSSGGYIKFSTKNTTSSLTTHSSRNHNTRNRVQTTKFCGKLEELQEFERRLYFTATSVPILRVHELPIFSLTYRLVDFCYNITLTDRNGSIDLEPSGRLECTFKIHLPYGNRIALRLQMGPIETNRANDEEVLSEHPLSGSVDHLGDTLCHGLQIRLTDGVSKWSHCAKTNDPQQNVEIMSRENSVVLRVDVTYVNSGVGLKFWYHAEPITNIVSQCPFGWVAVTPHFCVFAADDMKLSWHDAEMECKKRGGHLASILTQQAQDVVDNLLLNSPGYRDHNAYWIGATDQAYEGDFRWSDGLPFSYTNWFPGWNQDSHHSRQPNDDGYSDQDCVEVRRAYHLPPASYVLAASFHWNDRDCSTLNHFLCEQRMGQVSMDTEGSMPATNNTVVLSRANAHVLLTSPGFPGSYPDNVHCDTDVTAPHGFRIVLEFDELVLENEQFCRYDFLEIIEMPHLSTSPYSSTISPSYSSSHSFNSYGIYSSTPVSSTTTHMISTSTSMPRAPRRICGDWSTKLKLLRHVSVGSHLKLRFVSDYSHHFSGFKARVSMENAMECADDKLHMFNQSCYLFVSYPQLTWFTAQEVCKEMKAHLASIVSPEEERFVISSIRRTSEYSTSAIFWLGGKVKGRGKHEWVDGSSNAYSGWLPGRGPEEENEIIENPSNNPMCLGIQWMTSTIPMFSSGLYWKSHKCHSVGGYVCKRRYQLSAFNSNFNRTINGSEGRLTSPNYPGNYYHNLDYWVRIIGPRRTRLVVQFARLDIESQLECLYDYVELRSGKVINTDDSMRWCGAHDTDMERFNFVSISNEVVLRFHSDYSHSGSGFSATWQAVDVSFCPVQTLTAREGTLISPNYPHFLLPNLDCTVIILAPKDKRIWLEIVDYDLGNENMDSKLLTSIGQNSESLLELDLGEINKPFRPFQIKNQLTDGAYVSQTEKIKIRLRTLSKPYGAGFKAIYKTVHEIREERIVILENTTSGTILNLNYPMSVPPNVDYTLHFIAPLGNTILLELYHVKLGEKGECSNDVNGTIEVFDNYASKNGTTWYLCEDKQDNLLVPPSPLSISSYLNTLHIRQRSSRNGGVTFNGSVRVKADANYKVKLLRQDDNIVESCEPNPCQNNGKCVRTNDHRKECQCSGHFTGLFCALTVCELAPCLFGRCELTLDGHRCVCQVGYTGVTCEQRKRPCDASPCDGRGECVDRGDSFLCRCHAWWEGTRCERRMVHIPYKPLSERMLQEPFWLGLITVTVVLGIIGFVWCAKRHFPEKLEKLLAEEADRNRGPTSSVRGASIRDQLGVCGSGPGGGTSAMVYAASGASGTGGHHQGSGGACPRSLFGRLGIRKPSLLSLTSPHSPAGSHHHHPSAAARTFSLDDLLKPPLRRTPSPRKKRNNSTPTKKNAAEKKQILQQLISPATNQHLSRKVSLGELIQLSDRKLKEMEQFNDKDENGKTIETNFGGTIMDPSTSSLRAPLDDPKLEKKVTFARLLNKVSAEMSSGSEIELGNIKAKSVSSPPSPATDPKSPHSTSSNQGSDSLSSLEVSVPGGTGSISDLLNNRRNGRIISGRVVKPASADSILAMFRNFSSTSAGANIISSIRASPSSTPSASSPQDDAAGDDDSPTSSIHTPISFSSGPPDSPIMFTKSNSHSIEVPVLDPLSAHKSSSSGNNFLQPPTILLEIPSTSNKCLSPIRELPTPLPTPMPSPAITPMRQRSPICSSNEDLGMDISDDRISIELPCMSISLSEADDDEELPQDIVIDIQAADGLLQDEAHSSSQVTHNCQVPLKIKTRPPPIGQVLTPAISGSKSSDKSSSLDSNSGPPPPLIIPTLTIQTPSPTHRQPPSLVYPGSPPPQRSIETYDSEYSFPLKQQRRGLLKEFDKPTSLDLPCVPPMITITCNLSEAESDAESISPAAKTNVSHLGAPSGGMSYLSPFSMCTRADRTISESNLSSSGYSSMASPGPSRCGSNNPLCPSEMEDPGPPGSGPTNIHSHIGLRRPPLIKNNATNDTSTMDRKVNDQGGHCRGRSDSETLSDDPLMESNDEGIGTDHLDEKIEDGDLKSAKELEVFIGKDLLDNGKTLLGIPVISTPSLSVTNCGSVEEGLNRLLLPSASKTSLQLPAIVVQGDINTCDKLHPSPVSSRSESPLSDRTVGLGQFSPQFYNRYKEQLPFTDSDGLYDFPSSDCPPPHNSKVNLGPVVQQHRKSTGRRREKKSTRITTKTQSPTKHQVPTSLQHLLDIPGKEQHYRVPPQRKPSPKRRARTQQRISSSSSSESLNSTRELKVSSSSPSPDTIRWPASSSEWTGEKKTCMSTEASGEETGEDAVNIMIPKIVPEDVQKPNKKISRLRTISHQIRFLRRLEQSLKKRERLVSLSDSIDSGEDEDNMSPRATSPLLQCPKQLLPEIRKSSSISKLQGSQLLTSKELRQNRNTRYKKGGSQFSIPQDDRKWTRVPIGGNGFSD